MEPNGIANEHLAGEFLLKRGPAVKAPFAESHIRAAAVFEYTVADTYQCHIALYKCKTPLSAHPKRLFVAKREKL